MGYKCKNPYLDNNIDCKFVYLLNSVLTNKSIGLHQGFSGLWLDENKIGILETNLDFEMCTFKEKSVYEVFNKCIPDGMRYNKELDKLVPLGAEYCGGIKVEFEKVVDYTKDINIKEEDKQILDELKKSGKPYLEIINIIKNTDTFKKHNGGDGNGYYNLPKEATQLQDLIEFKNMNGNIKDIFKACWRKGDKKGVDEIYDVEKMVYYSLREAGRVLNTKDYISIATRIMGKQNVK